MQSAYCWPSRRAHSKANSRRRTIYRFCRPACRGTAVGSAAPAPRHSRSRAQLHLATAETGVAVASFYPDISLTGSVGTESLLAGNLFSLAKPNVFGRPFDRHPDLPGAAGCAAC